MKREGSFMLTVWKSPPVIGWSFCFGPVAMRHITGVCNIDKLLTLSLGSRRKEGKETRVPKFLLEHTSNDLKSSH